MGVEDAIARLILYEVDFSREKRARDIKTDCRNMRRIASDDGLTHGYFGIYFGSD
jgi:hypothetical protein